MRRSTRMIAGLIALSAVASGCYGPFNLTRRLYQWNGQVGTKWEREFMFIILAWTPVYGLAVLGDGVVFNSMEFWTGKNPVDPPGKMKSELSRTKRLARGDSEALLTYGETAQGPTLVVQQFQHGQPAGSLHLAQRDGVSVGSDEQGRVLFTAESLADGRVLVQNQQGKTVRSN